MHDTVIGWSNFFLGGGALALPGADMKRLVGAIIQTPLTLPML